MSEDLNSGLPRTNSASGWGGTWTGGLWIAILVLYPPGLAASLNLNLQVRPQWRVGEKPWEQGCWTSSSSCFQVISYLDPHQAKHSVEFYSYSSDCSLRASSHKVGFGGLSPRHHFPLPWKVGLGEIKENNQTESRTLAPVFHPLRSMPKILAAVRVRKITSEKTFLTLNLMGHFRANSFPGSSPTTSRRGKTLGTRLFPDPKTSHFQNEAKCKTLLVKMNFICMSVKEKKN